MKRSNKIAAGIALSLSLGLATAVFAHPGQMGGGMGPGAQGGMQHGAQAGHGGMLHGKKGAMGPGAMGNHAKGQGHGAPLMSPEERAALHEKMRTATPEERQKLAAATRAEMHKRAGEKGYAHPHRGSRAGADSAPQSPAATEHAH
jgi:hypothetical protein